MRERNTTTNANPPSITMTVHARTNILSPKHKRVKAPLIWRFTLIALAITTAASVNPVLASANHGSVISNQMENAPIDYDALTNQWDQNKPTMERELYAFTMVAEDTLNATENLGFTLSEPIDTRRLSDTSDTSTPTAWPTIIIQPPISTRRQAPAPAPVSVSFLARQIVIQSDQPTVSNPLTVNLDQISLPTGEPSSTPTAEPSTEPSQSPSTSFPTAQPSSTPTAEPSQVPTNVPSTSPTLSHSSSPSSIHSITPSAKPSATPTSIHTAQPSSTPTSFPTLSPSSIPQGAPSIQPSSIPTLFPTRSPSYNPSHKSSAIPTLFHTQSPSSDPSTEPSSIPTIIHSVGPSRTLSVEPSRTPSIQPTSEPSMKPTGEPTSTPSIQPTGIPTTSPSMDPSDLPSHVPSARPTSRPSLMASAKPTTSPSTDPSDAPSYAPSARPSSHPSLMPSAKPTTSPSTNPSDVPSHVPSARPSSHPSLMPSAEPSNTPTSAPSISPTRTPSSEPSAKPSLKPSSKPSSEPSSRPTISLEPSHLPSTEPSDIPSDVPSTLPSYAPSTVPSVEPTTFPSASPSRSLQTRQYNGMLSFDNIDSLSQEALVAFETVCADTIIAELRSVYTNNILEFLDVETTVIATEAHIFGDFDTNVVAQNTPTSPPVARKLKYMRGADSSSPGNFLESEQLNRQLQNATSGLLIEFNMVITVRSSIDFTADKMQEDVLRSFSTIEKQNAFISALQDTAVRTEFNQINQLDIEINGQTIAMPIIVQPSTESDSIALYGGISAGAAGFILLCASFMWWRRKPVDEDSEQTPWIQDEYPGSQLPLDRQPDRLISTIAFDPEDQDISTIGDPYPAHNRFGAIDTNDSISTPSLGGFDFQKAYGGAAGDDSISSTPGKKSAGSPGSPPSEDFPIPAPNHTRDLNSDSSQSCMSQDEVSLFSEDQEYEKIYAGRIERIEVVAPPGKLGVVIDTPQQGRPIVHAIKDTSVLADQVMLGDALITMDGVDTTHMSAMTVSKLISSKAQFERVLVFLRTPTSS